MLEPCRSHYLRALGVDQYVPRFPLVAAAPSVDLEWDDAAVADIASADEALAAEPVATGAQSLRRAAPPVDIPDVVATPADNVPHAPRAVPTGGNAAPMLRIKLAVVVSDSGVLIIDDANGGGSRGDGTRLLANLLYALQRKQVNLKPEVFDWPLPNLRNRQIALDENAARETLASFLDRKLVDGNIRTIFLLGAHAQRWIDVSLRQTLAADRALSWAASLGSAEVFADPLRKRQWWLDLHTAIKTP